MSKAQQEPQPEPEREVLATLTAEDRMALTARRATWDMQAERARAEVALTQMAQEAYTAFTRDLMERYELPARYEVDGEGNVYEVPEPEPTVEVVTAQIPAAEVADG